MEYLRFIISWVISLLINRWKAVNRFAYRRILIIRLDHLGDTVWCLQSIRKLHACFPDAHVTALIGEWNVGLFRNSREVNDVLLYNSPAFTRDRTRVTPRKDRVGLLRKLRSEKFDLIVGFRDDLFTIAVSMALRPRARVDRGATRIRMRLHPSLAGMAWHEGETNDAIVRPVLRDRAVPSFGDNEWRPFVFSREENAWLDEFLRSHTLRRRAYAVLHPGAAWPYRRWNASNFSEVAAFIHRRYEMKCIVIGTPDEFEISLRVIQGRNDQFVNATGKTTLRQMMILISEARLAVCNDSGPAHLAAIMRTPSIVLLGPEDVARFAPRGENTVCFHKKLECNPCGQITCKYPLNPCVNLNTVDEILRAIPEVIEK